MTSQEGVFLLLLALGVFLAPPVSVRLRIPAAIGEMLYGAILVAAFPALRHPPAFVGFLRHFGFLLVLFLAGLELNTYALVREGFTRFLRALPFGFVVPVGAMAVAVLLGYPAVLGLIVGTISIGLTTRVLNDLRLLHTPFGQVTVLTGGIGEVMTIISITLLAEAARGLNPLHLAVTTGKLFAIFGIGFVVLLLLRDLAWWRPGWFAALLTSSDSSELAMRSALALLAGFGALAVLLHVPDALAAFVAGQTLGLIFPVREDAGPVNAAVSLRDKLKSMAYAFFIPIAFITVGQDLDLKVLLQPQPLLLGLGMTLGSGLIRMLAMPLLRLQVDWGDAALMAILLSESLTMKVTVASLAVASHVLPAATLTPAIAATTAGDILFPIIFRWVAQRRLTAPEGGGPPGLQALPAH